jgi:integrase
MGVMATRHTHNNTYLASFTAGNRRFRKTFKTELEAQLFENETRQKIALGVPLEVDNDDYPTIEQVAWEVFDSRWIDTPNAKGRRSHVKCIVGFFGHTMRINALSASECARYVSHLKSTKGQSQSTVNGKISALTLILEHAHELGYVESIPRIRGRKKCNNECLSYISEKEEGIIVPFMLHHELASMRRFGEYWCWATDTGFRPSESRRLHKDDVYLDDTGRWVARLLKSKTDTWRVIPLTKRALAMWNRQSGMYPWLHMSNTKIEQAWNKVRKFRGRDGDRSYKAYLTRHTTGSRLVQRNVDLPVIQQILGHSDLTSTQRYAKVSPTNLFQAIEKLEQPTHI